MAQVAISPPQSGPPLLLDSPPPVLPLDSPAPVLLLAPPLELAPVVVVPGPPLLVLPMLSDAPPLLEETLRPVLPVALPLELAVLVALVVASIGRGARGRLAGEGQAEERQYKRRGSLHVASIDPAIDAPTRLPGQARPRSMPCQYILGSP